MAGSRRHNTAIGNTTAKADALPLSGKIHHRPVQADGSGVKKYRADFEVITDEEGNLCAADKKRMIFTDGRDKAELADNIRDAVECYYEVPYTEVEISIVYR